MRCYVHDLNTTRKGGGQTKEQQTCSAAFDGECNKDAISYVTILVIKACH